MKFKKVILLGSGKIAVECVAILTQYRSDVIAIEYRGHPISSVKLISQKYGLEYHQFSNKQDLRDYLDLIGEEALVISANNNYLFPAQILKKKNLRVINFHNALLPDYPGRNAPTWVIFNGEELTGITWHLVDEGVDTGDIVIQKKVEVSPIVTALELTKLCMDAGIEAFREMIPEILEGRFSCRVQDAKQRKNYHYINDIPNNGYLDISWSLDKVSAFLRSLNYGRAQLFPPSKVVLLGQQYLIQKYRTTLATAPQCHMILQGEEMILQDGQRMIRIGVQKDELEDLSYGEVEEFTTGN